MRALFACVVSLALVPAARAAPPDQDWVGTIFCDAMTDITRIPLRQPFKLTVRSGVVRYERNIRIADTSFETADKESGDGVVAPDGRVELNGSGSQPTSSYRSQYQGVLAGSHTSLVGVQHWRFPRHAPIDRACHIDLTHQL